MPNLLISGPAGAGKTQEGRREVSRLPNAILIDFQTLYASLLGIERNPGGRYPERLPQDDYALPLTEYTRRATITGAVERDLTVVCHQFGRRYGTAAAAAFLPGAWCGGKGLLTLASTW